MKRSLYILGILFLLGLMLLTGWLILKGNANTSQAVLEAENPPVQTQPKVFTDPIPSQIPSATPQIQETSTPLPGMLDTPSAEAPAPGGMAVPETRLLDPTKWENWPVLPRVRADLHQIYADGIQAGNDPHAFSILGDCQSQPDVFMGIFDDSTSFVEGLPEELQETVAQFSGSFDRYSPTVKDGTTEGALLWIQWNDNKEKKCTYGETPLDCELRVHKPSIVFIHVGTHYEDRNRQYLITILNKILDAKAIPVLVTKADNLERDMRINNMIALLASEYDLPLWNFWASVQDLPNHGLKVENSKYLTDEGIVIHRMGALVALDAVWRAVK